MLGNPAPPGASKVEGRGLNTWRGQLPTLRRGGGVVLNILSFCSPPTFTLFFLSSMLS